MKDQKAIVEAYQQLDLSSQKAALATVVKVRGSSYRSPGARMLITDSGKWVGSISGGCLEGDALRKARQVMLDNKAKTVTYDTREESNQNLGIGLGCNGVIDVLLEPLEVNTETNPINAFESLLNSKTPIAVATVFNSQNYNGEKFILTIDGQIQSVFSNNALTDMVRSDLQNVFSSHMSHSRLYKLENEEVEVFIELIQPTITLLIFGGGFDARPVSQLAKSVGWNVSVTDECVAHIAPIFFPSADQLSLCSREFIDRDFDITRYTACVLMSHNYEYDRDVLKKLLKSDAPYIGILGPRKRFDKMLDEFSKEGVTLSADDVHRIHSPIGLDIGAEAPDEIAVSIIAEVQGKFSNRSGGFLKYKNGPIHDRDAKSDQVFKQVYLAGIQDRSASK
jgi:xanthine dehydrogenase accessory factor